MRMRMMKGVRGARGRKQDEENQQVVKVSTRTIENQKKIKKQPFLPLNSSFGTNKIIIDTTK
jgi:hypothetical protein